MNVFSVINPSADVFFNRLLGLRLKENKMICLRVSSGIFRSRLNKLDPKTVFFKELLNFLKYFFV